VARRAWDMGVVMDIGHGAGSFSFNTAGAMINAGHQPDVISSDIHQFSIHGPLFDLPTCMSKFLALGMTFPQVVEAATSRPAAVLGLQNEIGTLQPGALADVALFRLEQGDFPFYDVHMNQRNGNTLIRNTVTIVNGRPMALLADPPPMPWIELTGDQRSLIERGHTPAALAASSKM